MFWSCRHTAALGGLPLSWLRIWAVPCVSPRLWRVLMDSAVLASQTREILNVVAHSDTPVLVLQAPSLVITAASPGAHELLDPIAQPLIGRRLRDFSDDVESGALPLLTTGRITGYETLHKVRSTGQPLRLWIGALPNMGSRRTVIAVLLHEVAARRVAIPWKCGDLLSPVMGSTDANLMVDRVSCEVYESLGYRPEEIIGTSLLALVVLEDVDAVLSALAKTSKHKESVTCRVGVVDADQATVNCQLVLLPLTPVPSCAFALRVEGSEGPADGRAVADLITRLGLGIRGAMTSSAVSSPHSEVDLRHLCSREIEIVSLLIAGHRVCSIARRLSLSEGTIRTICPLLSASLASEPSRS
jgi:hypothetical protein